MNAAAADFAPAADSAPALVYLAGSSTTFDLLGALPAAAPAPTSAPRGTFVESLVESLDWTFGLDAVEAELAEQLLFGRSLGAVAVCLGVDAATASAMCRALFQRTGTDGRQRLFELALRLTATRQLSKHIAGGVKLAA